MGKELSEIKKMLKDKSHAQVAVELGYRSHNTIVNWIKNKKIPTSAILRVRRYLNELNIK